MYINRVKNLHTILEELGVVFPEIFKLYSVETLENTVMDQEMKRPMTETEEKRLKTDIPRETITVERIWNKRPDSEMDSLLKYLLQRRLTNLSYWNKLSIRSFCY
jgi:hypothetical protein